MHGVKDKGARMALLFDIWLAMAILLLRLPRDQCADIIGGRESIPHSRPFMALIQGEGKICGGTLIKPNWVLTAAHCELGENPKVILGAHSRSKTEPSKQNLTVAKQISYPCFDREAGDNDLMLLQLKGSAKITKQVATVKLTKLPTDIKTGTQCLVAGWGSVRNRGKASDTLQEVNVTVIERRLCNDNKHYNSNPVITINMVCAGDKKGRKDSCSGDSGGPLICNGEQKAVVSFGKKCGSKQFPGVYARLRKAHLDWIRKTTGGDL